MTLLWSILHRSDTQRVTTKADLIYEPKRKSDENEEAPKDNVN